MGDDWWLERHEYDGSEWFELKECPDKPKQKIELKALTIHQAGVTGWQSLMEMNKGNLEEIGE